jgi:hypothetical protein
MARMFEYYRMRLDRNYLRDLQISKQELMTLIIDPRIGLHPAMK